MATSVQAESVEDVLPVSRRVMAYCHDSVGLGHLRRTLAICESVGSRYAGTSFLLATGTPYYPLFRPGVPVDYIKLPALIKQADGAYGCKYLGISVDRLMRCREALLLQAAESFEPDLLLVDKAPLGVCRELVPTLRWLRRERPGARLIFGMRDIEDAPEITIAQWTRNGAFDLIEECYDEVWVYGMRSVFDVAREYQLPAGIRSRLHYVGYIRHAACQHPVRSSSGRRDVLVTVGGGTDGEHVIAAYLGEAARRLAGLGVRSTIVGGPDLPPEAQCRLQSAAERIRGVAWVDFEECMSCRIRRADLVVSMGGYNTLCELAAQRKPTLVVPRNQPRLEQTIRAQLWEQRHAVAVLPREKLTAHTLADRVVELLLDGPRMTRPQLDFRALPRIVDRFRALLMQEAPRAARVHM